jgi:ferredoxin--NADP+ reductase
MIQQFDNSGRSPSRRVAVLDQKKIAHEVYSLTVERPFTFSAGQCVAIAVQPDGPARYYSIASGENEDTLSILYDLIPDGELTPQLAALASGDSVLLSDPFGSFIDDDEDSIWIATGTGIAPFLSRARSSRCERKSLIYGGRLPERFYFAEELSHRLEGRTRFCCSQCGDNQISPPFSTPWTEIPPRASGQTSDEPLRFYPGRLTSWLRKASQTTDLPRQYRYFLCGSAGMIVDVRDILISASVPFDNIFSEIYF